MQKGTYILDWRGGSQGLGTMGLQGVVLGTASRGDRVGWGVVARILYILLLCGCKCGVE